MTILGIGDASEFDTFPTTDWSKAYRMGCRFAIVRATTTGAWVAGKPSLKEDLRYLENVKAMDTLGMQRQTYAWFDPRSQLTGAEQAQFFINTVNKTGGPGQFAIADVEGTSNIYYNAGSIARLKEWLYVVAQTGWRMAIYSYPSFIDQLAGMADISWMIDYELIIANWDVLTPRNPWPWHPRAEAAWQYTGAMKGSKYGFYANPITKTSPLICMAVME